MSIIARILSRRSGVVEPNAEGIVAFQPTADFNGFIVVASQDFWHPRDVEAHIASLRAASLEAFGGTW